MRDDNEFVAVTLDRQRPYRANENDIDAVWVGPGEASVPAWVAQEWGMLPPEPPKPPDKTPDHLAAEVEIKQLTAEVERLTAELEVLKQVNLADDEPVKSAKAKK